MPGHPPWSQLGPVHALLLSSAHGSVHTASASPTSTALLPLEVSSLPVICLGWHQWKVWGDGSRAETLAFPGRPEKPVFNASLVPNFPSSFVPCNASSTLRQGAWGESRPPGPGSPFFPCREILSCLAYLLSWDTPKPAPRRVPPADNSHDRASFSPGVHVAALKTMDLGLVTAPLPSPAPIFPPLSSPQELQACLQALDFLPNLDALKGTLFEMETWGRC